MPLVKNGKIATDAFVQMADDAQLPGDGPILISAARFLENAEALSHRAGKLGVIWPNNRDVDDLVPYLDRLAVVALMFPSFDGRAYSRRAYCGTPWLSRRIAPPEAARPVRVPAARRLRCLRGEEGRDAVRLPRHEALLGVHQPTGDGRHRAPADAAAALESAASEPRATRCTSTGSGIFVGAGPELRNASPAEVIAA
jgi:hypothetical protein